MRRILESLRIDIASWLVFVSGCVPFMWVKIKLTRCWPVFWDHLLEKLIVCIFERAALYGVDFFAPWCYCSRGFSCTKPLATLIAST